MDLQSEAVTGLIRHLTVDELRSLMNDDTRLSEMIADLPQMRVLSQEQEMLLVANKSLAEHNISLEPKLTEGKRALIAEYEEASKLANSITSLKAAADSSSGQYKPDTIQALLQTAAHEKEEESEKVIQGFLDKELSVEDFLSEFIEKRAMAHVRRIKAEKVAELIRCGSFSNGAASAAPGPAAPTPYPPLPYPTGSSTGPALPYPSSFNMPMPGF
ncbi:vacuolar protein sorting-associated protein 37B [Hyalella azteca]|uniref:Vacuolar protein sorting-associated protein 37B n=1 Tax=Hyalella azteca TaxID=294128 RepID=A0A8B7P059_HYAAZ|nr:vacuolar protein sorting-associated protein 37B [Hyalella azteca]